MLSLSLASQIRGISFNVKARTRGLANWRKEGENSRLQIKCQVLLFISIVVGLNTKIAVNFHNFSTDLMDTLENIPNENLPNLLY